MTFVEHDVAISGKRVQAVSNVFEQCFPLSLQLTYPLEVRRIERAISDEVYALQARTSTGLTINESRFSSFSSSLFLLVTDEGTGVFEVSVKDENY